MSIWSKIDKEMTEGCAKLMSNCIESLGGEKMIRYMHRFRDRDACEVLAFKKSGIGYKFKMEEAEQNEDGSMTVRQVAVPGRYFPPPFPPND